MQRPIRLAAGGQPGVRVRIKPHATLGADAAPVAGEERAAEQVRPDFEPVVAPFIALWLDAREGRSVGEEGKLNRFGHSRFQ